MNIGLVVSVVCGAISAVLILGLVFSSRFRSDVLGGQGEATVLGLVTAKGTAIIVLCALFIGGMLFPLFQTSPACEEAVGRLSAQLEEKFESQIRFAAAQPNLEALSGIVQRLQNTACRIKASCH